MNYFYLLREVGVSYITFRSRVLFRCEACRFTGQCLNQTSLVLVLLILNSQNRQFRAIVDFILFG